MLSAQQHRIRFSDSVESGSLIFPLSGVAFLLVEPGDSPEHQEDCGLLEQIGKFLKVHRNTFVLLYAPFNGKRELETLCLLQQRFFGSNLRILPVRNNADLVKGMLTIAKATCKPHAEHITERLALARAHIVQSMWEMLRDAL